MAKRNNADSQSGKPRGRRDQFFTPPKKQFKQSQERVNFRTSKFTKKTYDQNDSLKPSSSSTGGDFFVKSTKDIKPRNRKDNFENSETSTSKSGNFFVKANTKPEDKTDDIHKKERSTSNHGSTFMRKQKNECQFGVQNSDLKKEKRPFDKKKWRLQKYSKKYKLEQWEDKRKKAVMREYYKQTKYDEPKLDVQKIYEEAEEHSGEIAESEPATTTSDTNIGSKITQNLRKRFTTLHDRFLDGKEAREARKAEALRRKEEKEAALREYKKKKAEKYKKLNQKTRKGQPLMKHRIEMLLEEIQESLK